MTVSDGDGRPPRGALISSSGLCKAAGRQTPTFATFRKRRQRAVCVRNDRRPGSCAEQAAHVWVDQKVGVWNPRTRDPATPVPRACYALFCPNSAEFPGFRALIRGFNA